MTATEQAANKGHGHVVPRPDGVKARCGGTAFCKVCKAELAALENPGASQAAKAREALEGLLDAFTNPECGEVDRKLAVKDARAALASLPQEPALCMCKDRPKADCPGEWEPGCDLGNNQAFVRPEQDQEPARTQARIEAVRPLEDSEMAAIFLEEIGFESGELQEVNFDDLKNIAQRIEARALAQNPPSAQEPASQEAEKLKVAIDWIYHAPHGDNCYLTDEGDGSTCTCGKESVLSFLESDAAPEPASQEAERVADPAQSQLMAWALTRSPAEPARVQGPMLHTPSGFAFDEVLSAVDPASLIPLTPPASPSVKQSLTVEQAAPLTDEQINDIWLKTSAEVAKLELEDRYEFASWLKVAVRLVESANGITAPEGKS